MSKTNLKNIFLVVIDKSNFLFPHLKSVIFQTRKYFYLQNNAKYAYYGKKLHVIYI